MGQITEVNGLDLFVENGVYNFGEVGPEDVIEYSIKFLKSADDIETIQKGCFDEETEVLTSEGWKHWPDVTGNELFLSTDSLTGRVEWVRAVQKVSYQYDGMMDSFTSRDFDLLTTPDHTHYVTRTFRSDKHELVDAAELHTTKKCFVNIAHGEWEGVSPSTKELPGNGSIPFEDYVELMAWYLSEGCCFPKKERPSLAVFDIRQYNVVQNEEIRKVVERSFGKKTHGKENDRVSLYIPIELGEFFMDFGKTHSKSIPSDIKNSSKKDILRFLQTYIKGDGHQPKQDSIENCIIYTASHRMSDDLSEMIIKAGYRPIVRIRPPRTSEHSNGEYRSGVVYEVRVGQRRKCVVDNCAIEQVPYKGKVYDVTLEKYHTLYVRRNGKCTISGNCGCTSAYWDSEKHAIVGTLDMSKAGPAGGYPSGETPITKYVFVWLNDGQSRFEADSKKQQRNNPQKAHLRLTLTGKVVK